MIPSPLVCQVDDHGEEREPGSSHPATLFPGVHLKAWYSETARWMMHDTTRVLGPTKSTTRFSPSSSRLDGVGFAMSLCFFPTTPGLFAFGTRLSCSGSFGMIRSPAAMLRCYGTHEPAGGYCNVFMTSPWVLGSPLSLPSAHFVGHSTGEPGIPTLGGPIQAIRVCQKFPTPRPGGWNLELGHVSGPPEMCCQLSACVGAVPLPPAATPFCARIMFLVLSVLCGRSPPSPLHLAT
jgi:hypothetical protein